MKKLVAISVAATMLLGLAGAAMAAGTATDWTILFRASDTSYNSYAGLIQVGTATGKLDTKDSTDSKITGNTGGQAQVASYEPTFGDVPPLYNQDKKAPITTAAKTWDLVVWVGTGYTQDTARLAYWSTSTLSPINTGVAANWQYTISVASDPTGTYTAGTSWTFTPGAIGTSTAPVGYIDFRNIQNTLKTADSTAAAQGVHLTLTAGPVVPEPSSMLALASGLAGIAGFAIRRRRA